MIADLGVFLIGFWAGMAICLILVVKILSWAFGKILDEKIDHLSRINEALQVFLKPEKEEEAAP